LTNVTVTLWQSVRYVAQTFVCSEYKPDTIRCEVDSMET